MATVEKRKLELAQVRLSPTEKAILERLAERELTNVSNTLRGLIRERARAEGLWPPCTVQGEKGA